MLTEVVLLACVERGVWWYCKYGCFMFKVGGCWMIMFKDKAGTQKSGVPEMLVFVWVLVYDGGCKDNASVNHGWVSKNSNRKISYECLTEMPRDVWRPKYMNFHLHQIFIDDTDENKDDASSPLCLSPFPFFAVAIHFRVRIHVAVRVTVYE